MPDLTQWYLVELERLAPQDKELQEEVSQHLREAIAAGEEAGLATEEAQRIAVAQMGSPENLGAAVRQPSYALPQVSAAVAFGLIFAVLSSGIRSDLGPILMVPFFLLLAAMSHFRVRNVLTVIIAPILSGITYAFGRFFLYQQVTMQQGNFDPASHYEQMYESVPRYALMIAVPIFLIFSYGYGLTAWERWKKRRQFQETTRFSLD